MVPDLGPSPGAWSNSYLALERLVDPHSNGGALYAGEVTVANIPALQSLHAAVLRPGPAGSREAALISGAGQKQTEGQQRHNIHHVSIMHTKLGTGCAGQIGYVTSICIAGGVQGSQSVGGSFSHAPLPHFLDHARRHRSTCAWVCPGPSFRGDRHH